MALLDVMLPDIDGFEVLQKIREKYNFPVIMLTAKTEYMDKINGLMLGADDYMAKPFNPLGTDRTCQSTDASVYQVQYRRKGTGRCD